MTFCCFSFKSNEAVFVVFTSRTSEMSWISCSFHLIHLSLVCFWDIMIKCWDQSWDEKATNVCLHVEISFIPSLIFLVSFFFFFQMNHVKARWACQMISVSFINQQTKHLHFHIPLTHRSVFYLYLSSLLQVYSYQVERMSTIPIFAKSFTSRHT